MKVMCIKNLAKDLDLNEVKNIFVPQQHYGLIIGREYLVMGMVIYKDSNCLHYLIDNDGSPNWYPYMLFEITNKKLPSNWYVDVLGKGGDGNLHTLIGFKELCLDDDYHDALIAERDQGALQTYFKRKEELFYDYFD